MITLTTSRRRFITGAAACLTAVAQAQAPDRYPDHPVRVIVPFAPGGSVDTVARLVLQGLGERLKQSFVIENVAGASGTIGTQRAARATADGHTLLFAVASPINVAPLVTPSIVRYDALRDFAPVATVASSPFVLIGSPKLQADSTADVLAMARRAPGQLHYGTDGLGTSMHLTAEIVQQAADVTIRHVPFRNGPQVLTEVAAGRIELAVMPLPLAQPFIADGKVRAYGVTTGRRWHLLPDVPALAETAELKSVDFASWYGLLAPAATPSPVIRQLADALGQLLQEPGMRERLLASGLQPLFVEWDAFGALLQRERDTLAAAIRAAAIQLE